MKEPKFPLPAEKMKDIRLLNGLNRIIAYFHAYARDAYCPGDMFTGWDWPTMGVVFPELVGKYKEMQAETRKRLEATGGKFAGKQWERVGNNWKVKE